MGLSVSVAFLAVTLGCGGGGVSADPKPASVDSVDIPVAPSTRVAVSAAPVSSTSVAGPEPGTFEACVERARNGLLDGPNARAAVGPPDLERFAAARQAERSNELDLARKTYLDLIMKFPKSSLVVHCYFAFGELFLREGATDPSKLSLAEQAYAEVLKWPPPDNGAFALAQLRLGQVMTSTGDHQKALSSFTKAIDAAKPSSDPCLQRFAERGREKMVDSYAEIGRVDRAATFFKRYEDAGRPGQDLGSLEMRLLDRYAATDHPIEALGLVSDFIARSPGEAFCKEAEAVIGQIKGGGADASTRREASRVGADLARACKPPSKP